MYSPDTTGGVARIIVTAVSPGKVTVTHKVKSATNHVVWIVFNATFETANVCVTNFDAGGVAPNITFLPAQGQGCVAVDSGKTGLISAIVSGDSGVVYTYNVRVGGAVVIDPELEI